MAFLDLKTLFLVPKNPVFLEVKTGKPLLFHRFSGCPRYKDQQIP